MAHRNGRRLGRSKEEARWGGTGLRERDQASMQPAKRKQAGCLTTEGQNIEAGSPRCRPLEVQLGCQPFMRIKGGE